MTWNHDLSAAPHDKPLWLASKCKKVTVARWSESRKAWQGFGEKEKPIAWQIYVVPAHSEEE